MVQVIFGTLLTTMNKPMFAMSGWIFTWSGTVGTAYWITSAKVGGGTVQDAALRRDSCICATGLAVSVGIHELRQYILHDF